jgi:predicted metal-binding protein
MRMMSIVALLCFASAAMSDEKKPSGTWVKKVEGFEIKFAFKKGDVMVFSMGSSNESCQLESKCTFEKDGVVKCKVSKYTKNGNFPEVKEGFEFSFKFSAKDKSAKVSDINAADIDDTAKTFVEGDYEKATD